DHRVPPAGWSRRAGRHPHLRRLHGAAVLRLPASEADRARQQPRRGARPHAAGARLVYHWRRDHDHPLSQSGHAPSRLHRRPGGHEVPRARAPTPPAPRPGMRIDVHFTPLGLAAGDLAARGVVVIDALRATTTIVTALANGAKAVI